MPRNHKFAVIVIKCINALLESILVLEVDVVSLLLIYY